jgi:hypothetical protein
MGKSLLSRLLPIVLLASPTIGFAAGIAGIDIGNVDMAAYAWPKSQELAWIDSAAATGAKSVRMILDLHPNASGMYSLSANDLQFLDIFLQETSKLSLVGVVAVQPDPAGSSATYWNNASQLSSIENVLTSIVSRYKNQYPYFALDLINEPVLPGSSGPSQWRALALQWVTDIRAIDQNRQLVIEPSPWANETALAGFGNALPFKNIAYSIHFYYPQQITHQGVPGKNFPVNTPYPGTFATKASLSTELSAAVSWANAQGVKLYVGEFGCVYWAPGAQQWLQDVIALLDAQGWDWSMYAIGNYRGWDPRVPTSVSMSDPNWAQKISTNTPIYQMLKKRFSQTN